MLTLPLELGHLHVEFVEAILRILNFEHVSAFVYADKLVGIIAANYQMSTHAAFSIWHSSGSFKAWQID
jgi:hypothetical protein